jgi:hypothetical protein
MRSTSNKSHFSVLISVLSSLHWSSIYASDADMSIDYAPILQRCCSIIDEPSILENCSAEYSAIRITEGDVGYPVGLIRVERQRDGVRLISAVYESYDSPDTIETDVSESDWAKLVGLLESSGFWTFETPGTVWRPGAPSLWIEACVKGQFRSISIYSNVNDQMTDVVDFLVRLKS